MVRSVAVALACLSLLVTACGGSSDDEPASSAAEPTPTESTSDVSNGCEKASQPPPKDIGTIKKPTETLDAKTTYVATVSTSCGEFQITLDAERAPKTGGSFKYLADQKFFDNLSFHRIVKDFVVQGGDPAGDGSGGPGYTTVEAPPKDLTYDKGVVAMAKTGTEPAGAAGSQFFVVTGPGAATLPPEYALLGAVTSGMDVVDRINGIEADPNGTPVDPVEIESIRVKGS